MGNAEALVRALRSGKLSAAGVDVEVIAGLLLRFGSVEAALDGLLLWSSLLLPAVT